MEEATGRVVLTDFGIARLAEGDDAHGGAGCSSGPRVHRARTGAGPAGGTGFGSLVPRGPAVRGHDGRPPFHRDSLGGVLHAVMEAEIRRPPRPGRCCPSYGGCWSVTGAQDRCGGGGTAALRVAGGHRRTPGPPRSRAPGEAGTRAPGGPRGGRAGRLRRAWCPGAPGPAVSPRPVHQGRARPCRRPYRLRPPGLRTWPCRRRRPAAPTRRRPGTGGDASQPPASRPCRTPDPRPARRAAGRRGGRPAGRTLPRALTGRGPSGGTGPRSGRATDGPWPPRRPRRPGWPGAPGGPGDGSGGA